MTSGGKENAIPDRIFKRSDFLQRDSRASAAFEISIGFTASTPGDDIRVLTAFSGAAAAAPATVAALAAGLVALVSGNDRRR